MKILKASVFKATCLKVMDEVADTGEPVLVTKNGRPVGQFVPYRVPVASLSGMCSDQVVLVDDVIAPVGEPWDAAS